jgi:hypothetical protein
VSITKWNSTPNCEEFPALDRKSFDYQPYYCEENIYRLCVSLTGIENRVADERANTGDTGTSVGTPDPEAVTSDKETILQGSRNMIVDTAAVFITNADGTCALRRQRAVPPGEFIVWDYHVILLVKTEDRKRWVLDFDTRLGFVTPADEYIESTFDRTVPPRYRPLFRVVPAVDLLTSFSTDRRHMRRDDGTWIHPPPPWDPPQGPEAQSTHELPRFLDVTDARYGRTITSSPG